MDSRKAAHQKWDCKTKRRFRDRKQADAALRAIGRNSKGERPTRCYQCPHCKGWHLTRGDGGSLDSLEPVRLRRGGS